MIKIKNHKISKHNQKTMNYWNYSKNKTNFWMKRDINLKINLMQLSATSIRIMIWSKSKKKKKLVNRRVKTYLTWLKMRNNRKSRLKSQLKNLRRVFKTFHSWTSTFKMREMSTSKILTKLNQKMLNWTLSIWPRVISKPLNLKSKLITGAIFKKSLKMKKIQSASKKRTKSIRWFLMKRISILKIILE